MNTKTINQIFPIEVLAKALVKNYTSYSGIKVSKTLNNSVYCYFLPSYIDVLVAEANYLLQQESNNKLTQEDISIALSRSVNCLKERPIKDVSILRTINYNYGKYSDDCNFDSYEMKLVDTCYDKMRESDSEFVGCANSLADVADDILKHWDVMWNQKESYELLACVFSHPPIRDINVYTCIGYIKNIEIEVIKEYVNEKI